MSYSKKDKKKISRYIGKLHEMFSLGDWQINWVIAGCRDETVTHELQGQVQFIYTARKATIYLSPFMSWPEIKTTIRHEMLHLVLAEYREICEANLPDNLKRHFESADHAVINRLNPLLEK